LHERIALNPCPGDVEVRYFPSQAMRTFPSIAQPRNAQHSRGMDAPTSLATGANGVRRGDLLSSSGRGGRVAGGVDVGQGYWDTAFSGG